MQPKLREIPHFVCTCNSVIINVIFNNFTIDGFITLNNNYFAGIWSTNMDSSNVYGIPWYVDTRLLFYRKDIGVDTTACRDIPANVLDDRSVDWFEGDNANSFDYQIRWPENFI